MAAHGAHTVFAVPVQGWATTSPAPHAAHSEHARSAVAVQGPEAKVPAAQVVAQGEHTSSAPIVPRDVVPALQRHALPAADHVVPAAEHTQAVVPLAAFELPAPHALQAEAAPAAGVAELQPKPCAQAHELWPGCASAPREK